MISIEKNRTILICMFAAFMILAVPAFAFAGNTAADTDNANPNLVYRDIEKSWPKISNSQCYATEKGVKIKWAEVYGADSYEVWRAAAKNGTYEEFAATEKTSIKKDTDGAWYYRVRAVKGKKKSLWSRTVYVYSQSGYVTKKYQDKNGYTHFQIKITNRTDTPAYCYGPGLYNAVKKPFYWVDKYDLKTGEALTEPYPVTAQLKCPMYCCREIPAEGEGTIDVYTPRKLKSLGESGMADETAEYRVTVTLCPGAHGQPLQLTVTDDPAQSAGLARYFNR